MAAPNDTFKKAPKRPAVKGRRIVVSAEAKAAYEATIREKAEREAANRHLPPDRKR